MRKGDEIMGSPKIKTLKSEKGEGKKKEKLRKTRKRGSVKKAVKVRKK